MKLWAHQQKFLDANPDIAVLSWDAGTGKTRAAIEWVNKRDWAQLVLVVCPKAIQQKWKDDMKKWGCRVMSMVVTKEEVKKIDPMSLPSKMVLIADEAHHYTSPLFVAKDRSQVTEAIYKIIRRNQKMPRLFLTATPVRSSPANMHTLLYMTVKQIDWKKYQEYFYRLQQLPYLPRPAWIPKPKWQKEMQTLIDKYCNVVLMKDCFDVPIHEYTTVAIELSKETKEQIRLLPKNEWEAVKLWYAEHRLESGIEKLEWIKEFSEGQRKIVIVCRYKEQIAQYAKELSKKREVFVLTGDTKDQGQTIKDAQESPECFIIIQSQVCAGFDLDQFSCMIFTSIDFSYVNFTQMHGRINRAHNLHRNRHYYLVAGEKDKLVLEAMDLKQDFDINKNIKNETKRTSI
jgi:superfamily II DNA or RNA helicase